MGSRVRVPSRPPILRKVFRNRKTFFVLLLFDKSFNGSIAKVWDYPKILDNLNRKKWIITKTGSIAKVGDYPNILDNLNRKKSIFLTPLNWLLNAFIFALNDSAEALVLCTIGILVSCTVELNFNNYFGVSLTKREAITFGSNSLSFSKCRAIRCKSSASSVALHLPVGFPLLSLTQTQRNWFTFLIVPLFHSDQGRILLWC